jgi:hypothetical protein
LKAFVAKLENLVTGMIEGSSDFPEVATAGLLILIVSVVSIGIIHAETIWQRLVLCLIALLSGTVGFRIGRHK